MFSPITWHHIIFQISSHCITIYHVLSCNIVISLQTSFCFTVIFPKKTTPANPGVETTPKKNTLAAPLALLGKNEESPCLLRYLLPSWTKSPEHKALLADQNMDCKRLSEFKKHQQKPPKKSCRKNANWKTTATSPSLKGVSYFESIHQDFAPTSLHTLRKILTWWTMRSLLRTQFPWFFWNFLSLKIYHLSL